MVKARRPLVYSSWRHKIWSVQFCGVRGKCETLTVKSNLNNTLKVKGYNSGCSEHILILNLIAMCTLSSFLYFLKANLKKKTASLTTEARARSQDITQIKCVSVYFTNILHITHLQHPMDVQLRYTSDVLLTLTRVKFLRSEATSQISDTLSVSCFQRSSLNVRKWPSSFVFSPFFQSDELSGGPSVVVTTKYTVAWIQ